MANPFLSAVFVMALGLTGCALHAPKPPADNEVDPPPAAATSTTPGDIDTANDALMKGRYAEAEALYTPLSQQGDTILRRQALTGLTLLYLSPENPDFNVNIAIDVMDQLNALLDQERDQQLLFATLKQLLENTVTLTRQQQLGVTQVAEIRRLKERIEGLETALERLRRISLQ